MRTTLLSFLAAITLVLASTSAAAFSTYRSRIPNGNTSSCATCHVNTLGGEGWNEFGKDLLRQDPDVAEADLGSANENINYDQIPEWNADLCGLDSDGDGQSNGEELGDPACSWVFGDAGFPRTTDISNPGDADSTSANPTGTDGGGEGEGEGEGEGGEGEGEGEPPGGGCSSTTAAPMGAGGALLALLTMLRARRRA